MNDLSVSNRSSPLENHFFYNCTSPRFGAGYQSTNFTIIDYYRQPYQPKPLTCCTHVSCNVTSASVCLDRSDTCDGKLDCINGSDGRNCQALINNQFDDNDEYRCDNSQCIPKTFTDNPISNYQCLDRSDERHAQFLFSLYASPPTLQTEDVICLWCSK